MEVVPPSHPHQDKSLVALTAPHDAYHVDSSLAHAVEQAERCLLQGNFASALRLANQQYLLLSSRSSSNAHENNRYHNYSNAYTCQIPCQLFMILHGRNSNSNNKQWSLVPSHKQLPNEKDDQLDEPWFLKVSSTQEQENSSPSLLLLHEKCHLQSTWMDRLGAVALQSWYEIDQAQQSTQQDPEQQSKSQHSRRDMLRPFWDHYRHSSMDPALALVWLQFCHARGLLQYASHVATELLVQTSAKHKNALATWLWTVCLPSAVQNQQQWLAFMARLEGRTGILEKESQQSPTLLTRSNVYQLLEQHTPRETRWGVSQHVWDHCRDYFQDEMDREMAIQSASETRRVVLSGKPCSVKNPWNSWISRLRRYVSRVEGHKRTALVLSMFSVLVLWRQRLVLARISRRAWNLLLQPIREIVAALLPT